MVRKVDVIKAVKKLPYEAIQQLENVLADDNLRFENVDIQYIIHDVKWTIERLNMDLGDLEEDDPDYRLTVIDLNKCLKWMKYYSRYEK